MSLLINDMDMPKSCMECELRFTARGFDTECIFSNDTVDDCTDRRLYHCPLVEIPTPHGRLIDADELVARIENDDAFYEYGVSEELKQGLLRAVGHIIEMDALVELD